MIAQKAEFELLKYKLQGRFTEYIVKLHDADGEVVNYHITDYYNDSEEIIHTKIWVLEHNVLDIKNDSRLGKKILTFITNEHFYRGDVIESMFIAGREDRLNKINDSLSSFMKT